MSKYTLLQMTQTILSSMNSDQVNSINDTPEALQVATAIKTAYEDIIGPANLKGDYTIFTLGDNPAGSVIMDVPDHIDKIDWIKYTNTDGVRYLLESVPLETLLEMSDRVSSKDEDVSSFDYENDAGTQFSIYFATNKDPQYYATVDNRSIIFDSVDAEEEAGLNRSKFECYGRRNHTFAMADDFIPDLDDEQFPLLLQEAKSLCWLELRQQVHPKAERSARRHWNRLSQSKLLAPSSDFDMLPNYGRK